LKTVPLARADFATANPGVTQLAGAKVVFEPHTRLKSGGIEEPDVVLPPHPLPIAARLSVASPPSAFRALPIVVPRRLTGDDRQEVAAVRFKQPARDPNLPARRSRGRRRMIEASSFLGRQHVDPGGGNGLEGEHGPGPAAEGDGAAEREPRRTGTTCELL
jgi:hypothetical protein